MKKQWCVVLTSDQVVAIATGVSSCQACAQGMYRGGQFWSRLSMCVCTPLLTFSHRPSDPELNVSKKHRTGWGSTRIRQCINQLIGFAFFNQIKYLLIEQFSSTVPDIATYPVPDSDSAPTIEEINQLFCRRQFRRIIMDQFHRDLR